MDYGYIPRCSVVNPKEEKVGLPKDKKDALIEKISKEVYREAGRQLKELVDHDIPIGEAATIVKDGHEKAWNKNGR